MGLLQCVSPGEKGLGTARLDCGGFRHRPDRHAWLRPGDAGFARADHGSWPHDGRQRGGVGRLAGGGLCRAAVCLCPGDWQSLGSLWPPPGLAGLFAGVRDRLSGDGSCPVAVVAGVGPARCGGHRGKLDCGLFFHRRRIAARKARCQFRADGDGLRLRLHLRSGAGRAARRIGAARTVPDGGCPGLRQCPARLVRAARKPGERTSPRLRLDPCQRLCRAEGASPPKRRDRVVHRRHRVLDAGARGLSGDVVLCGDRGVGL